MEKKRFRYISLFLCILFVCGNFVYIPQKNEVKAFAIPAGVYIVASLLIASGVTVANSENLEGVANTVYNTMPTTAQGMFDVIGNYVDAQSVKAVTVGATAMAFFNAACQTVFGISPDVNYSQGVMGNTVNNTASYTSVTVPIDLESVSDIFTFGGSVVNQTFAYGGVQAQFVKDSTGAGGNCYIELTCADGYKIRMNKNFLSGSVYYPEGFGLILPVVYGSESATPIIKFYIHGNNPAYNQPEWIEMNSSQNINTRYWNETTQAWVNFSSMNLYNTIMLHMESYTAPAANIDQAKYNETVNNPAPTDTAVKASQDLNLIAQNTASTITAIGEVALGVDNMSTALRKAIEAAVSALSGVFTGALSGINTIVSSISTTVTNTLAKVTDIANSITAPATVAISFAPLTVAGTTVSTRFPFSIPFDFIHSIQNFNVGAVAPHFVWDFPDSYFVGGGQIDINFAQFEDWAKIIRWATLLSYSVGLILLTRSMIGGD